MIEHVTFHHIWPFAQWKIASVANMGDVTIYGQSDLQIRADGIQLEMPAECAYRPTRHIQSAVYTSIQLPTIER